MADLTRDVCECVRRLTTLVEVRRRRDALVREFARRLRTLHTTQFRTHGTHGAMLYDHGIGVCTARELYALYCDQPVWMQSTATRLKCAFHDKDRVKSLGARWDGDAKSWYVPPSTDLTPFAEWLDTKARPTTVDTTTVVDGLAWWVFNGSHNVRGTPLNVAWRACASSACRVCNREALYGVCAPEPGHGRLTLAQSLALQFED